MKPTRRSRIPWLLAIGALCVSSTHLTAATRAKANNADNLNLASSWTNNLIPGSADVALFDSVVTTPISVSLGANTSWNQINFANPGGDVTLSAGNTLTLSNNTPLTFGAGTASHQRTGEQALGRRLDPRRAGEIGEALAQVHRAVLRGQDAHLRENGCARPGEAEGEGGHGVCHG